MEAFMIFLTVFMTFLSAVCTALLVPLRQYSLSVNPKFFKRVRVKFPAFLFVGIGDKSEEGDVKNFGVIVPMFVLHIVGYVLALFICALVPILYQAAGIDTDVLFLFPLGIAMLYVIAVVVTEYLCVSYSRKKQLAEDQPAEQPTESEQEVVEEEQPAEEQVAEEQATEEIAEQPKEQAEEVQEQQPVDESVEQEPNSGEQTDNSDSETSTDNE